MKNRSHRLPHALSVVPLVRALSGLLLLSLQIGAHAQAQEVTTPEDEIGVQAPVGPPPRIWVVPRISIAQGFSNNGQLSTVNRQNEQTTEIVPGIGVTVNTPRLRGFLDYSLRGIYDSQNTVRDNYQQTLNANATFEAWDNRAFIDVSGVIGQQAISAFESPSVDSLGNRNLSETTSFRVSPYLKGNLTGAVDYELRYTLQNTRTETGFRSDISTREFLSRLGRPVTGQSFGWSVEASRAELDDSFGLTSHLDAVTGRLDYAVAPTLTVSALLGVESNDLLTSEKKSYRSIGFSLDWRPSDRTRVVFGRDNRYFGQGHNLEVEYRSRRSVWRYVDSRDVVTSPLDSTTPSLGSLYGLIDSQIGAQEPGLDPITRAQRVDAELRRLGLPADFEVFPRYLTSSASVQRTQELSLGLFAPRDALIFAVARGQGRQLNPVVNLGDDFGLSPDIQQQSWSVSYAHRLTPLTSVNVLYARQTNEGLNAALNNRLKTVTLGVTTRLALRTSGVLQFRRSLYSGTSPYRESALLGVLTHRF